MPSSMTKTLALILVLLIPILITTTVVSGLITDQYLRFEYNKANFPPDSFGFTKQQRFILASTNFHYVRAHLPYDELSKYTLNGVSVYSPREVSHMEDVRAVTQSVFQVRQIASILLLLLGIVLWLKGEHMAVASAVRSGGLVTSGVILMIVLLAVFAWQFWFNTLHLLFFQPGSWLFSYSDTLIRLFPVKFWVDTTLTISIISLIGGLIVALLGYRWRMALQKAPQTVQI